jgi:hypothetical protein
MLHIYPAQKYTIGLKVPQHLKWLFRTELYKIMLIFSEFQMIWEEVVNSQFRVTDPVCVSRTDKSNEKRQ